ncbi:MAG: metallophosphoesterase [Planctomycetota bacterium]|nr:metallophosphoesterase [Planctomycetota bacterium]
MRRGVSAWIWCWLLASSLAVVADALVRGVALPGGASAPAWSVLATNLVCLPGTLVSAPVWWLGLGVSIDPSWVVVGSLFVGWGIVVAMAGACAWLVMRVGRGAGERRDGADERGTSGEEEGLRGAVLRRRAFLARTAAGAAGLAGSARMARAALVEPGELCVRRYTVRVRGLARSLDGLKVVQISDTHVGPMVPDRFTSEAVRVALKLGPDVVVLTGDMFESVHGDVERRSGLFAPLTARGAGPRAVLGVLGNHDWYGDGPRVARALTALGVRMIDNGRVFFDGVSRRVVDEEPRHGGCVAFAGLGDLLGDVQDVRGAFGGVGADVPRVLLAHQPDTLELAALRGVRIDVSLCGHTHGGQIRLPMMGPLIVPSRFGRKYEGGLVESPVGPAIVSRGVGMSGLPLRVGVPPEVVEVVLRA